MIVENLTGFIATVINIDGDEEKLGRVQIRISGDQGPVGDNTNCPWAYVMVPSTSPAESGVGVTPNWINVNTTVFGVFLDGAYRNIPMILGALNQNKPEPVGPGISKFASGDTIPRNLTAKERQVGVDNKRNPNYKNNKVMTTSSKETPKTINHIFEIDDTPESERILVKHKSGSYVEFFHDGNMVVKSANSNYDIAVKDKEIIVNGNVLIKSDNTVKIEAKSIVLKGSVSVFGSLVSEGPISSKLGGTGTITDVIGQTVSIKGGMVEKIG
jgi:hypothetical protein